MTILANPYRHRSGADTAIGRLLGDEPAGMAIDFTTMQAIVRDDSAPVVSSLGDANALVSYISPTPKMVWNAAGVLGLTLHNVLLQSQNFGVSPWTYGTTTVVANTTTAPDGTMTASKLQESNTTSAVHQLTQSATLVAQSHTFSIYLKAAERTWAALRCDIGSPSYTYFDLANGVIGTVSGFHTPTMTSVGNGWYRCSIRVSATAATWYFLTHPASANNTVTYAGTVGSGIYVWGAQVNWSMYPLEYLPTTTVPRYLLPLDHDPITHEPLGVLLEAVRASLALPSEAFATTWTIFNAVVTSDVMVAPDGRTTGDRLSETAVNNVHRVQLTATMTAAVHVVSVFVKAGERTKFGFREGLVTGAYATFNLATGAVLDQGSGASSAFIINVGNGWYRVGYLYTATAASHRHDLHILDDAYVSGAPNLGHMGDVTKGLYLWGAQIEGGTALTSYIPLNTAVSTRNGDNLKVLGASFPLSPTAGTLYGSYGTGVRAVSQALCEITDGTVSNRIATLYCSSAVAVSMHSSVGGAAQVAISAGAITNAPFKTAGAYALNDYGACVNGGAVGVDTLANLAPGNVLQLSSNTSNTGQINGWCRQVKYLPRRASNAELQRMTT